MAGSDIKEGTVIHGTLQAYDLIKALSDELKRIYDGETIPLFDMSLYAMAKNTMALANDGYFAGGLMDEVDECLTDLFDRLNELAQEGMYFGAHPGDGSDFGWWKCEEDEFACYEDKI